MFNLFIFITRLMSSIDETMCKGGPCAACGAAWQRIEGHNELLHFARCGWVEAI